MTTVHGNMLLPSSRVFDQQEFCSNFQERRHWFNFILASPMPWPMVVPDLRVATSRDENIENG